VVQTADLAERIARTKVPAAALHDPALEARVRDRFTFSFHESMSHTEFDRPSLIVAGRQDSVAGFADAVEMLGCYPRATLAVLDCAGHSPGWERPELFLSLVRDWLDRMETT
jgi:pimeloyl-ACP methyl ester carboxylesterase